MAEAIRLVNPLISGTGTKALAPCGWWVPNHKMWYTARGWRSEQLFRCPSNLGLHLPYLREFHAIGQ